MSECEHPEFGTFIAYRGHGTNRVVWRCSHCRKEDVWGHGWQSFGPIECLGCGAPGTIAVLCSEACRKAYKHDDPQIRIEMAKSWLKEGLSW